MDTQTLQIFGALFSIYVPIGFSAMSALYSEWPACVLQAGIAVMMVLNILRGFGAL